MDIRENIVMAALDIRLNKMRSFLSMLGIIIGIASVIIIVSIGNGLKLKIISQFAGLGADRIFIYPSWDSDAQRSGEISLDDIEHIKKLRGVVDIAPEVNTGGQIRYLSRTNQVNVKGVDQDYFDLNGQKIGLGRIVSDMDNLYRQKVCVLNYELARKLFSETTQRNYVPDEKTIGSSISLDGNQFVIVGILAKTGKQGMRWIDPNTMFIPATAALRLKQSRAVDSITVQVNDPQNSKKIGNRIIQYLKKQYGQASNYYMQNPEEIQKEISKAMTAFTLVIGSIGGLSLFVGGIGIMNIMLASVAERTREVGIRKALGAKRRDVLIQFLIEAGTISGLGGIGGIILGTGLAKVVSIISSNEIPSAIVPSSVFIAFVFSIAVGMFFGIYPASKAANMNPIEALRYE